MRTARLILASFCFVAIMLLSVNGQDDKMIGAKKYHYDAVKNKVVTWCDPKQTTKCECTKGMSTDDPGAASPQNNCVELNISLGRSRYSTLSESVMLQLNERTPNSALYSPSGFKVVAGFAIYSVSRETNASGIPKYVSVTHPSGVIVDFAFADNESVGVPRVALDDSANDRLAMVDAQGWATASDPAYYDYYPGDGSRWRFGASSLSFEYMQFVEHQTPQGRIETTQDMGLELIRDADGVMRQVRSAAWLADFQVIGQDAYNLSIYPNDASCVSGTRTAEGCYMIAEAAIPHAVWEFRNPDPGTPKDLLVTKKKGAVSETWFFKYEEDVQDFTLIYPQSAKIEQLEQVYSDDGKQWRITRTLKGSDGCVFSKESKHYVIDSNGSILTSTVRDPDGLALTTTYGYYSGGVLDGLEKLTARATGQCNT